MSNFPEEEAPPLRNRQILHSNIDPRTPTPPTVNASVSDTQFQHSTFGLTTISTSSYSSFQSAWLKRADTFLSPLLPVRQTKDKPRWATDSRRLYNARNTVLLFLFVGVTWWLWAPVSVNDSTRTSIKWQPSVHIFENEATRNMRFIPASHPLIHYVGRWVASPNRLEIDGTFPGVYLDINVTNTSTVTLSLKNAPHVPYTDAAGQNHNSVNFTSHRRDSLARLSFHRSPKLDKPSPPVPLVARINQDEYVLLPNSSGLVSLATDLNRAEHNTIKVIYPTSSDMGHNVLQLEGIWMDKTGSLACVKGATMVEPSEDTNSLDAILERLGLEHRQGLEALTQNNQVTGQSVATGTPITERKRMLEVLTDAPGSLTRKSHIHRDSSAEGLLSGVTGWEYLIGDMFDVDRSTIAVDRMCMMQECKGGFGAPEGFGDVFFRSGSPSSPYFERPWMFDGSHVPDVLVLNLGQSDAASFSAFQESYKEGNRTLWDLHTAFEDTYVSLVKAIRKLAYPTNPSTLYGYEDSASQANIPIFIMRPLTGSLEHATLGAAERLRADGDSTVFWIDTSGWLEAPPANASDDRALDYWLDESFEPSVPRLTEIGNQRVAIFLHEHLCRYLAEASERCAFLAPDVYEGKGFVPEERVLERVMETERERKLKQIFGIGT